MRHLSYIDALDICKLPIDFQAERAHQLTVSREEVDRRILSLSNLSKKRTARTSWKKISWQSVLSDGQVKHVLGFAERSGLSLDEALDLLSDPQNKPFAYFILGKAPETTNYQEHLQYNTLRVYSLFYDAASWKNLPTGGKSARFLDGAGHAVDSAHGKKTKSLDFTGSINMPLLVPESESKAFPDGLPRGKAVEINIAAKYTQGEGGSQDNQANDLELFAKYAAPRKYGNPVVVLQVDGDYYSRCNRKRHDCLPYAEFIAREHPDKNVLVTDTAHFDVNLAEFLCQLAREALPDSLAALPTSS